MDLVAGHHGAGSVFGAGEGGEGDGWRSAALVGREFADGADEFVAVFVGHADVAEDQVGLFGLEQLEAAVGGLGDDARSALRSVSKRLIRSRASGSSSMTRTLAPSSETCSEIERGLAVGAARMLASVGCVASDCERQGDGEGRALAFAATFGGDASAVQFDEVLDDRQAEAEAAVVARGGGVGLAEAVEDVGQELGGDALAGVAHGDFDVRIDALEQRPRRWPPLGVNLMALESRFQTTCCSRAGSPETGPASGSSTACRRIPLARRRADGIDGGAR